MFVLDRDYTEPCRDDSVDPEFFFANEKTKTGKRKVAIAKAACRSCRVRLICLEKALDFERISGEPLHGIHGGLTEEERKTTTFRRIDGGRSTIHREDATNEQGLHIA